MFNTSVIQPQRNENSFNSFLSQQATAKPWLCSLVPEDGSLAPRQ